MLKPSQEGENRFGMPVKNSPSWQVGAVICSIVALIFVEFMAKHLGIV
ncbi:hypothetical protein [Algicola sagamiensis]|nr:hypothetical protein [Algicola sagamiensis]